MIEKQPRCPNCGAATPHDLETIVAWASQKDTGAPIHVKCQVCGKRSEASEWLKPEDDEDE